MNSFTTSCAFVGMLLTAAVAQSATGYEYARSIGRPPRVAEPIGIAVDGAGTLYVADRTNGQVLRVPRDANTMSAPIKAGLVRPTAVAVAANGSLLVADEGNGGGVAMFAGPGGASPQSAGGFRLSESAGPGGVASDAQGNIYVTDQFRNVLKKYSRSGALLATWGQEGDAPGSFRGPRSVAVDKSGYIYIADEYNNRIQKFDAAGKFVGMSSDATLGFTISEGMGPMSVAVDSKGGIWVAAHTNFHVYKLTPEFRMEVRLDTFGRRPGELAGPVSVAVDSDDNVYVLDRARRVQRFSSKGDFEWIHEFPQAQLGELSAPTGVHTDANGDLWVADTANFRIQKFAANGTPLLAFGEFGHGDGQFNGVESIAFDHYGALWAVDSYNHRVQKFSPNGVFQLKIGSFGRLPGEFIRTKVIETDPRPTIDVVYVNDWHNARVQAFDLNGKFLRAFGDTGPNATRVLGPTGLAVDMSGNVYVSSWFNNAIQKFDQNGKFLMSIGGEGVADGKLKGPARLTMNSDGDLVVADWGNSRVQVFAPDGKFVSKVGGPGRADGRFDQPVGVTVDSQGNLFVSDAANSRVEQFRATAPARRGAEVGAPAGAAAVYAAVALFDVKPGSASAFEAALRELRPAAQAEGSFINDRVMRNVDPLTLQYATYTRFTEEGAAKRVFAERIKALSAHCRRDPEVHYVRQTHAYSPEAISESPTGKDYAVAQTGQIAHIGLFIPIPQYRGQYNDVLLETKRLTRARAPKGYMGEDLLVELDAPAPLTQAPYSPRPTEPSPMSINYGEYATMENAEDSYITRQTVRDQKLITMERVFFSSLQVPTRFYIFQVIGNYGRSETMEQVAADQH